MQAHSRPLFTALFLCLLGISLAATVQAATDGKIPITTSSDAARQAYLEGRQLFEQLRGTEARTHYQRALELDPGFALAHLGMANTATTATGFWASMASAVAAAGGASDGERWMILGLDAGFKGDPASQEQDYRKLVATYPGDERAHGLLAGWHFGRQEYKAAIAEYQEAIRINPAFAAPYNQMGYAYRFVNDNDAAERAFKQYIELIPDEPNPYDSYAEFMMKSGRFEESIASYRRALEHDPQFMASFVGIGNNYVLMGDYEQARKTYATMLASARDAAEQRQALLRTALSHIHEGNSPQALAVLQQRMAIAEKNHDPGTVSTDLNLMGDVQLEAGNPGAALALYRRGVETIDADDDVPTEVKEGTHRNLLYHEARVALAREQVEEAATKTQAYGMLVAPHAIPFEVRRHHELEGMIALATKDYATATEQLLQANQQDPRVLYLTALAYEGAGQATQARAACEQAANFNGLDISYAYVRARAQEMLAAQSTSIE